MLDLQSLKPIVTTRYMRWTRSCDGWTIALTTDQNKENAMKTITTGRGQLGGGFDRPGQAAGGRASYTIYSVAGRIDAAPAAA
jgi:hypothetical protein